jgi:CxxC-x17-CxxC domain-containing protein
MTKTYIFYNKFISKLRKCLIMGRIRETRGRSDNTPRFKRRDSNDSSRGRSRDSGSSRDSSRGGSRSGGYSRGSRSGGYSGGSRGGGDSGGYRRGGQDRGRRESPVMHEVTCDKCHKRCEVPFLPSSDKPVYCSDCFRKEGGDSKNDKFEVQLDAIHEKLDKIMKALNL